MTIASNAVQGRTRDFSQRGIALVPNMTRETAGGAAPAQVPLARQSLRSVTLVAHRVSQSRPNWSMIELR